MVTGGSKTKQTGVPGGGGNGGSCRLVEPGATKVQQASTNTNLTISLGSCKRKRQREHCQQVGFGQPGVGVGCKDGNRKTPIIGKTPLSLSHLGTVRCGGKHVGDLETM